MVARARCYLQYSVEPIARCGLGYSVVRTGGRFETSNSKHRTAFTACLGASNKHLGLGELAPRAARRRGAGGAGAARGRVSLNVAVGLARGSVSFVM